MSNLLPWNWLILLKTENRLISHLWRYRQKFWYVYCQIDWIKGWITHSTLTSYIDWFTVTIRLSCRRFSWFNGHWSLDWWERILLLISQFTAFCGFCFFSRVAVSSRWINLVGGSLPVNTSTNVLIAFGSSLASSRYVLRITEIAGRTTVNSLTSTFLRIADTR